MIEETFKNTLKKYSLLRKKDKLLLGVSGGPDSVCLLKLFAAIKKEYKLQLVCVHFNHGLRAEADQEEQFIKELCASLNLRLISEKKSVGDFFDGDS